MKTIQFSCLFVLLQFIFNANYIQAQEVRVHWDVVQAIFDEGFGNSHIMEDASYLCDVFGPRLPGSPSYLAAARWVEEKFKEYGLENVRMEPYEFGTGWQNEHTSVHMVSPQYMRIIAYPQSWSSGTNGKIIGPVILINFQEVSSVTDLAEYRGKLKDAIIFTEPKRALTPNFRPDAVLFSNEELDEMASITIVPTATGQAGAYYSKDHSLKQQIIDFVFSEGAAAIVAPCRVYDDGTVMVTKVAGEPWAGDAPKPPTELVMAPEHYNRIIRIMEKNIPVEMEVEIRNTIFDEDSMDYNIIAEIPGTDLADEVVMLGAHLDAHGGATGAEDNATGAAQVLEAARILKSIGVKPRRTIQFALWGGEETGHLGSRAYVKEHFLVPGTSGYTEEHENFSCYFNLDYGTGKIRGIFLMNNFIAQPLFDKWMEPYHNLGMRHLILEPRQDIGSDHEEFEAVGLPVFPYLQDPVENDSKTFHSNMDVYDKIIPEYLIQGAVIVAGLAYHAAMHKNKIPRKPLPIDK